MNRLEAKIEQLNVYDPLSMVKMKLKSTGFSAIVIDTPQTASYLKVGNRVQLLFKETEVVIGKGHEHLISLQNKLEGKIRAISFGNLLCRLELDTKEGTIVSIITKKALEQLQLKEGDQVVAMIKTNEILLAE